MTAHPGGGVLLLGLRPEGVPVRPAAVGIAGPPGTSLPLEQEGNESAELVDAGIGQPTLTGADDATQGEDPLLVLSPVR